MLKLKVPSWLGFSSLHNGDSYKNIIYAIPAKKKMLLIVLLLDICLTKEKILLKHEDFSRKFVLMGIIENMI